MLSDYKSYIPGPSTYDSRKIVSYNTGRNAPKYTIGARFNYPRQDAAGPSIITPVRTDIYKVRAPAYHLGSRIDHKVPRAYEGRDDGFMKKNVVLQSTPAFTIGSRLPSSRFQRSGGMQGLQNYDPYSKGPAYSFGVKHSEYVQNPMPYCDHEHFCDHEHERCC